MIILIIGPSGVGKDTEADLLSQDLSLPTISTGELLRDAFEKKTPEGLEAEKYSRKGKWPPTDLMVKILRQRLEKKDCRNGFILNGYPRTLSQAKILDSYFVEKGLLIDKVLYLRASDETCIKRLLRRKWQEKGVVRSDDSLEIIKERLSSFHRTIGPILDFYLKKDILLEINAEQAIDEVHQEVLEKL